MDGIVNDHVPISESFIGKYLASTNARDPWLADYANFLVGNFLLDHLTHNQRNIFFDDLRHYFWSDPYLYHYGPDEMIRKCCTRS
jgi:hypothetical protein